MKYQVIAADPPWHYNSRAPNSESRFGGGVHGHYNILRDNDIAELGKLIQPIADDNCALFMWAVMPKLDVCIDVLKAWGFRYATNAFTWVKTNPTAGTPRTGPGYYTASNVEIMLLGIKGRMPPARRLINSVVMHPILEHSKKPEEFQDRIELMYPQAKKIELFARRDRDGWVCTGDQLDGLDIREFLKAEADRA